MSARQRTVVEQGPVLVRTDRQGLAPAERPLDLLATRLPADPLAAFAFHVAELAAERVAELIAAELKIASGPLSFSPVEAAEQMGGISVDRVYALCKSGRLRSIRDGHAITISRQAIHEFLGDRPR